MATSASKMLLKVQVNTEMIREVFDALPAKATRAFVAEESSWTDVLASDSSPPRQSNPGLPLQQAPMGTPARLRNLPAPAVTPSKSPAAATLEAAATLTPSRLPRDESGKPVALESDTQHAGPPQPLVLGFEPEPLEPEPEPEQLGAGGPMAVQRFTADLRHAKAEAKELKAGLAAAEQRATDAQTSSELLHDELEKARAELLKAWEESLGVREATPEKPLATPEPVAVDGEPLFESAGLGQLKKSKEKVFVLEAQLEAGDAEIRRLEQLLASAQAGGGEADVAAVKPERQSEEQQEQAEVDDAGADPAGFLRITNLHHKVKGSEIKELLGTFGEMESSEVVRDVPFSTATVQFSDPAAASAALAELNGVELAGAPIAVKMGLPAAVASGLDQLNDLAGLLASSEEEQAKQTARVEASDEAPHPLLRSSSSEVAAVAAKKQRHDVEAHMLRSRLATAEGEAELAKREAQMLRRQLGILRCQPENDEVATQLESEDRKLEGAKAELSRLQMEASAVEERLKMRRAGLEAAGGGVTVDAEDGAAGSDDLGGGSGSARVRSCSSDATVEAMRAIELAQERSRSQWLEEKLARLTKTCEKDRSYFEKQLAEFAGESSIRLRQQKQSARLERMRGGTYVQRFAVEKGGGGAVSTHRRFMRVSDCGSKLLWGKSETDQQLMAVAINGIASVEIGHKTTGWKAVELAPDGGGGSGGGMDLPPEWQCLSFVLKDGTGDTSAMLLSADNYVDAALWCVGLRMLLEAAVPPQPAPLDLSEDDESDDAEHTAAASSLFDLRGRKRSLI